MVIYGFLLLILNITCIVHCIRHSKHSAWIAVILIFPLIGALIYLASEAWPTYQHQRGQDAANAIRWRHQPSESERAAAKNRSRAIFARQLEQAQQAAQRGEQALAIDLYTLCLQGPLENDPELLFARAELLFAQGQLTAAIEDLNRIRALSDYQPMAVRLLLARAYAAAQESIKAHKLFEMLVKDYLHPEIRVHYALFLQSQGLESESQALLAEVMAPENQIHLQEQDQVWIQMAQASLKHT